MQQTLSICWARKHSTSDTRVLGPVCQACAAQGVGWGWGAALDTPRGASACSPGVGADRLASLPQRQESQPLRPTSWASLPRRWESQPLRLTSWASLPWRQVRACRPLRSILPPTRHRGWRRVPSSVGRVLCWLTVPPQQAFLSQTSGFPFSKTSTRSKRELLKQFRECSLWL